MSGRARGGGKWDGEVKSRPPDRKDNTHKGGEPRESRVPVGLQKQPGVSDGVHEEPDLGHKTSVKQGRERQMINKQKTTDCIALEQSGM